MDAWIALDPVVNDEAPKTPFELDEYSNGRLEEGTALQLEADQKFAEGKDANQNAADYVLATVFFATVLFFASVATKFESFTASLAALVFAFGALGHAIYQVVSLPIA